LRDGILNPFDFHNIGVELDEQTKNRYDLVSNELNLIFQMGGGFKRIMRSSSSLKFRMLSKMNERKDIMNNYVRKFDVVKMICSKHKKDKILVFNEYNQQTNKCYWHLLDVGIKARIVHSGIEKEVRDQNLIDFKNDKFNVLLTSKVLDEGFNLPKIDTAVIMAGNSTAKQTIQRMGRVLRKKDKHSNLYQIYCKDTVEEDYGNERAKLFRQLCSKYNDEVYDGKWLNV
jgi:RNA polymerase primary sigma factor